MTSNLAFQVRFLVGLPFYWFVVKWPNTTGFDPVIFFAGSNPAEPTILSYILSCIRAVTVTHLKDLTRSNGEQWS